MARGVVWGARGKAQSTEGRGLVWDGSEPKRRLRGGGGGDKGVTIGEGGTREKRMEEGCADREVQQVWDRVCYGKGKRWSLMDGGAWEIGPRALRTTHPLQSHSLSKTSLYHGNSHPVPRCRTSSPCLNQ